MKKFKTKLGAFILASALLGGSLVACGSDPTPSPTPVVLKYFVEVPSDSKYSVSGISAAGYEQGTTVTFDVTLNTTEYTLKAVKVDGTALTADENGHYSFTMPAKDVDITVELTKIDVWTITFAKDIKVGQTVTAQLKLNDTPQTQNVAISVTDGTGSATVNGLDVTGVSEGTITIYVSYYGIEVYHQEFTVIQPYHGETEDDPLTAAEALAEAKKVAKGQKSADFYYVLCHVEGGLEKKTGTGQNASDYVNFDTESGFKIYGANYRNGTKPEDLDIGSKVLTNGKLYNYNNNTYELSPSYIESVDNSEPYCITADQNLVMLKPGEQSEELNFRIAPAGSSSVALAFASSNEAVATVADGKIVAGTTEGTAKITVTSEALPEKSFVVNVTVASEIHAGTEEDPLTAEEAWQRTNALPTGGKSDTEYFIRGVVSKITSKTEKADSANPDKYGFATWQLKTNGAPFTVYSMDITKDQESKLEVGAITVVSAKLYHYNNTMETSGGSVKSVDNTEVTLLELSEEGKMISVDETFTLTASILPLGAGSTATITWASSNEDAATVENGVVTPVAVGETDITATAGAMTATCHVSVTATKKIYRPIREGEFAAGQQYFLGADYKGSNLFCTGEVSGFYLGGERVVPTHPATVVEVEEPDGDYKYVLQYGDKYITYGFEDSHEQIGMGALADAAVFKLTEDFKLEVKGKNPDAAEDETLLYLGASTTSGGEDVIRLNYAKYLNSFAYLYILADKDNLSGIELNKTEVTINGLNSKYQLSVSPVPSTADLGTVKWVSDNTEAATVDENGLVTTVGVGKANIKAYIEGSDPEINATCKVTVTNNEKVYQVVKDVAVGDILTLACTTDTIKAQFNGIGTAGSNKIGEQVAYTGDTPNSEVQPLIVEEGATAGTFALKLADGTYLTWTSGNTLNSAAAKSANTSWIITFDADGNALIKNSADESRLIKYNSANPRFCCYTSAQTHVQLWGLK